jgi:hypothetical protein
MKTPWVRPAFAVAIAIIWIVLAWIVVSLYGLASMRLGWLLAALALLSGLAGAAVVWGGRFLWLRLVVAVALAVTLGVVAYRVAPPDHLRIHDMADDVDLPDGWRVQSTDDYGDGWCLERCPYVEYDYSAEPGATYASSSDELEDALRAQGWTSAGNDLDLEPEWFDVLLSNGRWWAGFTKPVGEVDATISVTYSAGSGYWG